MDKYYFLSAEEKQLIETFNKNEKMREAVRKVLLAGTYENGLLKAGVKADPTMNWALSLAWKTDGTRAESQMVGESLQIIAEGIKSVELAFKELAKFKKEEKPKEKVNPAR
jgi:hypothetical protein